MSKETIVHSLASRQRAAEAFVKAYADARAVGVPFDVKGPTVEDDLLIQAVELIGEAGASVQITVMEIPF